IGILPFSVFKISNSDYLIDKMSYSISPSVFEIYASLKSTVNFEFDTNFYDFKERLFVYKTDFKSSDNFQFSDLKYTKTEVEAINSLYKQGNSEVLGNKDATVANVLKSIPDADLIYFATHGKSSIKNPLDDSFIVLTNDSGLKNDFLTARDIQNLRFRSQSIDAKLAVLSACDTGLGKPEDGGIIGISRALQIAGANHVLMSLWNISDFETSEFMKMFFNELSKSDNTSLEPDTSLRKALLKFRKEVSNDPKHWAAFSLFGVPNPSKHTYGKSTEELNSIFSLYKDISIEDTSLKKNNEIIFDFKLVPVSDSAVSNKRFNPSELTKDIYKVVVRDSLIVEVHNNSKIPIYLSILDISEYQEYYNFLPNSRCSFDKNNRKVEPGQTIRFTDCVFTFSFDYGKYILKAIATSAPVNLRDDVEFKSLKEQTNQIIFNDGSTFFYSNDSEIQFNSLDLLYEIVEEP
ncbi:MAG: CHAT domain-containing protein, partial [Nonlabens sp.]|uniref:CHAT domain-containing protein n=1 Tax=Nonlabens sp. TaxID=1888209 RepID=UPI003EF21EE8